MKKLLRAEFHIHTKKSKDSLMGKIAILVMCKLRRINYIAISDHNEIDMAIKYKKYLERYGINVILSEEIFSSDGEIIGLYLSKKIQENLSAEETVKEIKEQGGLVYIPHPYDEKRFKTVIKKEALERIIEDVDFIECHNGRNIDKNFSKMQESICEKYKKIAIVGSDAHSMWELGRNYIIINEATEITRENIKEAIRNSQFVKKTNIIGIHNYTKIVKCLKMIRRGDISGIYKIIKRKHKRKL